jgi:octopine/nopaline transport system substrate-binding protein
MRQGQTMHLTGTIAGPGSGESGRSRRLAAPSSSLPPKARLILALLMALFALSPVPSLAGETIHIGTYRHYPPWTITDESGKISGFEIDLIDELCRRMDARCEIVTVDWERVFEDLEAKTYDAYIGCMTITDERALRVAFTQPYALTPEYFATTANSDLTTLLTLNRLDLDRLNPEEQATLKTLIAALNGKRVGVHVNTVYETFAKQFLEKVADVRVYHAETEKYSDMIHGRLDAILDGGAALHEFILSREGGGEPLTLFGPALTGGPFGHGVGIALNRSNTALRDRLDIALAAAKADGTLARLALTWFGYNAAAE